MLHTSLSYHYQCLLLESFTGILLFVSGVNVKEENKPTLGKKIASLSETGNFSGASTIENVNGGKYLAVFY